MPAFAAMTRELMLVTLPTVTIAARWTAVGRHLADGTDTKLQLSSE
jgi:hypothetical protein